MPEPIKISDEMIEAASRTLERSMRRGVIPPLPDVARDVVEVLAPLIAAQALRSAAVELSTGTYHRECSIAVVGQLRELAHALVPDGCCPRPNMVWEHSRGSKDHFRCHGCGGGMTKARRAE